MAAAPSPSAAQPKTGPGHSLPRPPVPARSSPSTEIAGGPNRRGQDAEIARAPSRRGQAEPVPRLRTPSPLATAAENDNGHHGNDWFPTDSPSARIPIVEVIMPRAKSPTTAKRDRSRTSKASKIEQAKRARCMIGSPSSRMIGRMAMSASPVARSPSTVPTAVRRKSRASKKQRELKSVYWKEFEPVYVNGEILYAKCIHCHYNLTARQDIGTSNLKKHLERCKARAKVNVMVEKLRAGATPADIDALENWAYDYDEARAALVRMIVLHELPFSLVEYDGFRDFVFKLNPIFKMVSRTTIKVDCMRTYEEGKLELQEAFKDINSKVSLTADMWTSNQTLGYLCVTCHHINSEWKIRKYIIKFFMMESPHNAQSMFNVILKCIQEWNLEDKIFSITLDNAQVNNAMIDLLRPNLLLKKMLPCEGRLFHVRCTAHVINLVVQDGLKQICEIVDNIRESVKYIKSSQSRREKFEEIVVQLGIHSGQQPSLDVSSRWNSTYLMLEYAYPLRLAFNDLSKKDKNYIYAPSKDEWERSRVVCIFLKSFYEATKVVSGSSYPTANLAFHELWKIKLAMDKEACKHHLDRVRTTLEKLFRDYSCEMTHSNTESPCGASNDEVADPSDDSFADWDQHQRVVLRTQASSELDSYLEENPIPRSDDFDLLGWWKSNSTKWPVLSRMARDVLTTPASSVASESAFSTGQRVVSDFRSRLTTETVEALICLQDWLRGAAPSPDEIILQAGTVAWILN
ncbi:hypothetical protein EJB05_32734 [Eragrostis curvula]|uniref:BED-type domain-containing protein n=1 Tax=Eragrostis curvula TaxID=38414 RepID=A0A5J9UIF1_9POAL|nr:hypothetical protein EJB05_32734 [Eragrostis curvula]